MKISDELRRWCDDAYIGGKIRTTKDLYAIADLIDREMVELLANFADRIRMLAAKEDRQCQ